MGFLLLNEAKGAQRETEPKLGSIDLLEYYNLRKIANFVLDQFNPRIFPPSLALDPKGQLYVKVEGETRIRQLQGTDVGLAKYGSQAAARPKPLTEAQIKPFTMETLDRLASSVSAGPMELPEEGRGALVEAPGEAQWIAKNAKKDKKKGRRGGEGGGGKRTRTDAEPSNMSGGPGANTMLSGAPIVGTTRSGRHVRAARSFGGAAAHSFHSAYSSDME